MALTPEELASRLNALKAFAEAGKALKAKKPAAKAATTTASAGEIANTLAERFNIKKTGYKIWRPVCRVVILEERTCACGATHLEWAGERYRFENGQSRSVWERSELYEVAHSENLPTVTELMPEVRRINGCRECFSTDLIESAFHESAQKELTL